MDKGFIIWGSEFNATTGSILKQVQHRVQNDRGRDGFSS
jgi:hypothetical protein